MNSFSNMHIAIESEIKRQIRLYEENPNEPPNQIISQATFRWDPDTKGTVLMRKKEFAEDYRYFPEPDLVPIVLTEAYIEKIRQELPELPLQRERRYVKELGLSPDAAFVLTSDKPLADYFEVALKECHSPRSLCNWLIVEFAGRYKETDHTLVTSGIPAAHLGKLVQLIDNKTITGKIAKAIADDMVAHPGKDPLQIIQENPDYLPMGDSAAIEPIVDQVIADHPQSIEDFKKGKDKAFSFLVGQVMKLTRGKASPEIVNDLIKKKIQ